MASRLSTLYGFVSRGLTARTSLSLSHGAKRVLSSSSKTSASPKLLNVVKAEISTEQKVLENLPTFSSFDVSVDGSIATLLRSYKNEEVKVQLDVNRASEVVSDEMEMEGMEGEGDYDGDFDEAGKEELYEEEGEDFDEKEQISVPVFSVSVKNEAGSTMQFDCIFDEFGPYDENMDWNSMRIDSASVTPSSKGATEAVYYANSTSFSEELYSGLLEFLNERGINEEFSKEILEFYRVFEHQCYVNDFLGGIRDFCSGK